jgi:hypothetical protein
MVGKAMLKFFGLGKEKLEVPCKYGNESSYSVKDENS